MNDRHRIKLICDDGCGAALTLRVDGTRDAEVHRASLRTALVAIAASDGWKDGRCPTCVRWASAIGSER
jgi:hypothetical protein